MVQWMGQGTRATSTVSTHILGDPRLSGIFLSQGWGRGGYLNPGALFPRVLVRHDTLGGGVI